MQISELRLDGQVYPVLRRNDFIARIRNAVVIGQRSEGTRSRRPSHHLIKTEDADIAMEDSTQFGSGGASSFPPQVLVLIFETCDLAFLILRTRPDGTPEFHTTYHKSPMDSSHIGYHMAVNPSWRYLVASSPNGVVVVYELESLDIMSAQYAKDGTFKPIKSFRARTLSGTITNTVFLYPRPEDHHHHVILLLTVVYTEQNKPPSTRMIAYDWVLGDSLKLSLAKSPIASRLADEDSIPVHVIPLTVQSAFAIISENSAVIATDFLSGSPTYSDLAAASIAPTRLHHGIFRPLWAAWARPYRHETYFEKTDIVYLAREDGAVIYLEIDSDTLVASITNTLYLDVNVDTAFGAATDPFSDLLIIGGDSGPGGIWKVAIPYPSKGHIN